MTTIINPAGPEAQAMFLRLHLGLMAKGLKHSKMSGTTLLGKVSALTGRTYKRGQYLLALNDLENLKEQNNG
jgi:hypothetical protein